ncbi:hypothetical protein MKW92_007248 [Papaver armeniacum]|nr:hypothetical protein MKW92_007248 [Papaver armeniacum]
MRLHYKEIKELSTNNMSRMGIFLGLLLVFTLLSIIQAESNTQAQAVFSVTDYGAVGDGETYDTHHIQAAIDACHNAGGGSVIFPKGDYLVGTIFLKSFVTLLLDEDSTILGGTNMNDYPLDPKRWFVILAENASSICITATGFGTIDGQGEKFIEKLDEKKSVMTSWNKTGACHGEKCRPRLVGFFDCKNVTVYGVELRIPALSNLHIVRCDTTFISDSVFESHFYIPYNHGIIIEDSRNTFINNTLVDNGGNAITLKTINSTVSNLTVAYSELRTKLSAIKFGSESSCDFRGIVFDNIDITDCHRGIMMQLNGGGKGEAIVFTNINVNLEYNGEEVEWRRSHPIYITTSHESSITNLKFINISSHSEKGVILSGGSRLLQNVELMNVNLTFYSTNWTEQEPSTGISLDYIDGLHIENMIMKRIANASPNTKT